MGRFVSLGLLYALLSANAVAAVPAKADCGNVRILSDELSTREAQAYCVYALAERGKVERYWGPAWQEAIRIHVDDSYRISKGLIPGHRGDRGLIEMPLRRVRGNDGALLHEIVHVYAPNDNRFLAEGLAVYLHHKLGGNRAFPNFGRAFDGAARPRLPDDDTLERLNRVRTPEPLGTVLDERTAYLIAGSFVGFLIERHGLPEFRKLYEGATYDAVYGKSLQVLQQEWRGGP